LLTIKGAVLGDRPVSEERVIGLANLPSTETLQAQMLAMLTSPLSGLMGVLNGAMSGLVGVLDARQEQLGPPEAA
jgi:large subunit ribosomal protein L10